MNCTRLTINTPVSLGSPTVMNASTQQYACMFVAEESALQGFYIQVSAVSGSPVMRFGLYTCSADGLYTPSGAELAYVQQIIATTGPLYIAANWSGLTLGARYFVVITYISGTTSVSLYPTFLADGLMRRYSSNSGASWSDLLNCTGVYPKWQSGRMSSYLPSIGGASTDETLIYASNEVGVLLLPSFGQSLLIKGITVSLYKVGTPDGWQVLAKCYLNNSLTAVSTKYSCADLVNHQLYHFPFLQPVYAPSATNIKLVLATETGAGGDNSNAVRISYRVYSVPISGELAGQGPFNNSWRRAVSVNSGISWTEDMSKIPALDIAVQFPPGSINRRQFYSQR